MCLGALEQLATTCGVHGWHPEFVDIGGGLPPRHTLDRAPEPTAVRGPTCMAFDQLARRPMTSSLRPGDHLMWFEAGAYHLSLETRFSRGHAEAWWHDDGKPERRRHAGTFEEFWNEPPKSGSRAKP